MKFTRIFILRALNTRDDGRNSQNPLFILKEIIISHPHIDLTLALILSIFLIFTKYNSDDNFVYGNSVNIYFAIYLNIAVLVYYFALDYLDQLTMIKTSTPGAVEGNRNRSGGYVNRNSNLGERVRNNSGNLANNNERTSNVRNEINHQNIPVNSRNSNSAGDNPFQINPENKFSLFSFFDFSTNKKIQLPLIIFKHWHAFKSILHFLKILMSISTYFFSILFCLLYADQKHKLDKEKYLLIHLLLLDFFEFYSGFRVCYFLMKIFINIFLLPVYASAIILGFTEDKFNEKLNNLINTRYYTGRSSIKSGRVSEMEEYCAICLNSFQVEETVSSLPCSRRHIFHTSCLEKWFINTVSCPLCRSDFHNSIELFVNGEGRESRDRPIEMQNLQENLL